MESCVVVCRRSKTGERKGKVLFIDALSEVTRERAQSFLKPEHQERILAAFRNFRDDAGFAKVATLEEIAANGSNLSIPLYVRRNGANGNTAADGQSLQSVWQQWLMNGQEFWQQMDELVQTLDGLVNSSD